MLLFDEQGFLTPYDLLLSDWNTVKTTFGWNNHRQTLAATFAELNNALLTLIEEPYICWIDGSFVTSKDYPNDIDVVYFFPTSIYRKHEQAFRALKQLYKQLDIYFVREIDENEKDYFLFVADKTEWFFQFTTSRPDRFNRKKFPKGFLQITWSNEQTIGTE